MSASTTDTAELPAAVEAAVIGHAWPAADTSALAGGAAHARAGRRQLREARRRERRTRRLVAAAGLVVLAGFLSATVVVVGVVR